MSVEIGKTYRNSLGVELTVEQFVPYISGHQVLGTVYLCRVKDDLFPRRVLAAEDFLKEHYTEEVNP